MIRRALGGSAAVLLLVMPQLVMPQEWIAASHFGRFEIWRLFANGLISLLFVPVLRLVSYRRRDWLLLAFVPAWQWVVAFRIGYRAAILPLHDWPPRPDERLQVRRLAAGPQWVLAPALELEPAQALPGRRAYTPARPITSNRLASENAAIGTRSSTPAAATR